MISVFLLWALRSLSRCAAAYHHVGSLSGRRYSPAPGASIKWMRPTTTIKEMPALTSLSEAVVPRIVRVLIHSTCSL
jgi:hypothetical protein